MNAERGEYDERDKTIADLRSALESMLDIASACNCQPVAVAHRRRLAFGALRKYLEHSKKADELRAIFLTIDSAHKVD